MKVKTKYGDGILLGVSGGDIISYKVLIDQDFVNGITAERIYNCLSIDIISEEGLELRLYAEDSNKVASSQPIMQESDSERLLEAYDEWLSNLSQEELAWYDGKYVQTFLASNGA